MVSQRFPRYVMNVSYRSLLTGFFNSGNGNKYLGAIYWQINCLWTKTLEKEAMSKFMHFLEKILCIISKMSENIVPKDFPTS